MLVAEIDPFALRGAGAALGLLLGFVGQKLADALPRRYGISLLVEGPRRTRRNVVLVALTVLCCTGIAHVVARAASVTLAHAALLLVTNAVVATCVLTAAAIDLEHMILPNELTLGPLLLCLVTSPLRSIGLFGSIGGAVVGLLLTYVPFLVFKHLRGRSGMGLGDAKLALLAGAWLGIAGVPFVLFLGALQSTLTALVLRILGVSYAIPESVLAEIRDLRERAALGDEDARSALEDDPMAYEGGSGTLQMRLPLGPFLALACVEVLFLRRWLVDNVFAWLMS